MVGILLVALSLWLAPPARADLLCPSTVSAVEFAQLIQQEVAAAYKVPTSAVVLKGVPAQGALPLPGGVAAGSVIRVRDQALRSLAGRTSLPVDILEGGKLKRMAALPIQVSVMAEVVVVKARVSRGTVLTASQLAVGRRPIHAVQRGSFARLDDVIGQAALVDLQPDTVVTNYLVRGTPEASAVASAVAGGVRIGAEVTVRIMADGLSLTGKGRVLDSGEVGDDVRVRLLNFTNSKVVKARVVNAHEVRVNVEETP